MERFIGEVVNKYQERLTEESKQIVTQAGEVAREFGHLYAHGGHLALPLLESPIIEQFLRKVGLNAQVARRNVEQSFAQTQGGASVTGEIRTTYSFNRAIQIADQSAGPTNPIKTENLFVGVVLERGLSGMGIHEHPGRSWRALLMELSTFCTPEANQVNYSEIDTKIKELRNSGVTNKSIREQLGITGGQFNARLKVLVDSGEVAKRPRGPHGERKGRARFALEQVLDRYMAQHPGRPVVLRVLAQEVGVSGERIRQLYHKIAAQKEVPPLIARELKSTQEEFDQQVKQLTDQGLSVKDISLELKVTGKLVSQAKSRIFHQEVALRTEQVKQLRILGYGNRRISEETGISASTVIGILQRLNRNGENVRLRKKYRTGEEAEAFREQLIQLRLDPRNLSEAQISEIIGESQLVVRGHIRRLIVEGRIPSRRAGRINTNPSMMTV